MKSEHATAASMVRESEHARASIDWREQLDEEKRRAAVIAAHIGSLANVTIERVEK